MSDTHNKEAVEGIGMPLLENEKEQRGENGVHVWSKTMALVSSARRTPKTEKLLYRPHIRTNTRHCTRRSIVSSLHLLWIKRQGGGKTEK